MSQIAAFYGEVKLLSAALIPRSIESEVRHEGAQSDRL
jgi:hypothetical protein